MKKRTVFLGAFQSVEKGFSVIFARKSLAEFRHPQMTE